MPLRPDALIPLVGAVVNFSVAVFVLLQSPRVTVARVFFLLGISLAVWNFGTYWMFRTPLDMRYESTALFWARFIQFGVIWIPLTLFHLSFLVADSPLGNAKFWRWLYGAHGLLWLSNFTSFVVVGVRPLPYAWYSVGGPGFIPVFMFFGLMWGSVAFLYLHRKKQPLLLRRRLTPLIVAQAAIAIFGSNDALPILNYDRYPGTNWYVYPFGSMAVNLYGIIVAYSVLQHQLLNVRVVLGPFAAHAMRMLFLFLTGACLLLAAAALTGEFSSIAFVCALGVLVVSAIIASTVFPKLLGGAESDLERRLLGDRFEYQDQVRSFLETVPRYTEIAQLKTELHKLLLWTFRLASYRLILREEVTSTFILAQSHPEEPSRPLPDLHLNSPVFSFLAEGSHDYLVCGSDPMRFSPSTLERRACLELESFAQELCFPLAFQDEPLGLLLVGQKSSGDPFTAADVRLLSELTKTLSAASNQIRLKMQIDQAHELDLLGRMSRGMAHDLNNLLTPISTLLQLSEETGVLDDELRPVAMRNLEKVREYIREALFFSENLRPDIQHTQLDHIVRQAIEVAANSRTKEVRLVPQIEDNVEVQADRVLVQRLIANLITNAIDASRPGGQIVISLQRLSHIDRNRDWLRVRIADSGEGIAPEDLSRIFTAYYTTKNRGDGERGFGLGLAICRKIATLHGGNLSIESQLKKGTTVQLDLPSRQASAEPPPNPLAVPTAA